MNGKQPYFHHSHTIATMSATNIFNNKFFLSSYYIIPNDSNLFTIKRHFVFDERKK